MKLPTPLSTLFVAFVLGLMLSACSVLDVVDDHEMGARALVDIATLAAIERSSDRPATALRVIQAAEDARTWLDFEGVTLNELATTARARIATSDLELSGKVALNALVDILAFEISTRVEAGLLDAEAKITVNRMLDWVIRSAQAYTG